MNNEAKTIQVFRYDKHTFNSMLKDVMKYDDGNDLNRNLFDNGLKSPIQRLTIRKQTHLNNKVSKWYNSELQVMKREKIIKYLGAKTQNSSQAWDINYNK